ncbi:MAG: glycosyltransferase [Rickettsiales bacterium]
MARIVIFNYDRVIDRRAILQCNTLIANGHAVTLYALTDASSVRDLAYVKRIGIASCGSQVMPLALRVRHALQVRFPGLFRCALPVLRWMYWTFTGSDPSSLYLALYKETLETVGAADLYIAHDLPMLPVALEAKRRYGGRVLFDSHELFAEQEFSQMERRMWRRLEGHIIGAADGIITVNPSIARLFEERYAVRKVGVVHNAELVADTPPLKGRLFHERLGLPATAQVLLYQGMYSYHRNLDGLVRAMQFVRDENIRLVLLGSGPAEKMLQCLAQQLGLAKRVHLVEAVPQAELLAYTASADVGVIPYRDICLNYRYCTPNKLFEFIAAGLPMVATDLPEITRLVNDHKLGFTGDTERPEALAALIERAFVAETLTSLRKQVLAARETVNWQHEGEHFTRLVNGVLTRGNIS